VLFRQPGLAAMLCLPSPLEQGSAAAYARAFHVMDKTDGDGVISISDMTRCFCGANSQLLLGMPRYVAAVTQVVRPTPSELFKYFQVMDTRSSGVVSVRDFMQTLHGNPDLASVMGMTGNAGDEYEMAGYRRVFFEISGAQEEMRYPDFVRYFVPVSYCLNLVYRLATGAQYQRVSCDVFLCMCVFTRISCGISCR
jgi:Ca2+-binding EF-hand superfamily protein